MKIKLKKKVIIKGYYPDPSFTFEEPNNNMLQQVPIKCPKCKKMVMELEFIKKTWYGRCIHWCKDCKKIEDLKVK